MSAATVQAVAFDAYGTLFDVYSVTSHCEAVAPGRGAAVAQLWRTKQLQYTLLRTVMGRYADFWQVTSDSLSYAAAALSVTLSPHDHRALLESYLSLRAFDDAGPCLRALRARGLRLAILSNGTRQMLSAATAHANLSSLMDEIISADEVSAFKPSPAVYALLGLRLGVKTDAIVFVSANAWDVAGARSAGLRSCWLRRGTEPADELGVVADHHVGSLTELSAVLTPASPSGTL